MKIVFERRVSSGYEAELFYTVDGKRFVYRYDRRFESDDEADEKIRASCDNRVGTKQTTDADVKKKAQTRKKKTVDDPIFDE